MGDDVDVVDDNEDLEGLDDVVVVEGNVDLEVVDGVDVVEANVDLEVVETIVDLRVVDDLLHGGELVVRLVGLHLADVVWVVGLLRVDVVLGFLENGDQNSVYAQEI